MKKESLVAISLLNADVKMRAKVLASRLENIPPSIISEDNIELHCLTYGSASIID